MNIPSELKYTEDHEWVKIEDDIAIVGITDFAQSELGELVYVEVDTVGETIEKGEVFGTVEAVKTTSELYMPISGEIIEFNPELNEDEGDNAGMINEEPYTGGWIVKIKFSNADEMNDLLDGEAYEKIIA